VMRGVMHYPEDVASIIHKALESSTKALTCWYPCILHTACKASVLFRTSALPGHKKYWSNRVGIRAIIDFLRSNDLQICVGIFQRHLFFQYMRSSSSHTFYNYDHHLMINAWIHESRISRSEFQKKV
jgi:hypothetical protein